MAQQDFPYYWPLGFATAGEKIPGAAILQRRDGKDEPITLAGNMVWTGSMWVPVSDQNRLPVEATLTGQNEALPVELKALDPGTTEAVSISAVRDLDGNWVVRTVDSAPVGWNSVENVFRHRMLGANTELVIEHDVLYNHLNRLSIGQPLVFGEDITSAGGTVTALDVSKYRAISFIVHNLTDVTITPEVRGLPFINEEPGNLYRIVLFEASAVEANSWQHFTPKDSENLVISNVVLPYLYFVMRPSGSATQGSLRIIVLGSV